LSSVQVRNFGKRKAPSGGHGLHAAIGRARLVIAQVNPELSWTHGADGDRYAGARRRTADRTAVWSMEQIDRAIADHVARLIPDRVTIELGLGAIPQAVTRALGRKREAR
jgi:acetyl-CoA hydrolase